MPASQTGNAGISPTPCLALDSNSYICVLPGPWAPLQPKTVWLSFTPALPIVGYLPAFNWTADSYAVTAHVPPLLQLAVVTFDVISVDPGQYVASPQGELTTSCRSGMYPCLLLPSAYSKLLA